MHGAFPFVSFSNKLSVTVGRLQQWANFFFFLVDDLLFFYFFFLLFLFIYFFKWYIFSCQHLLSYHGNSFLHSGCLGLFWWMWRPCSSRSLTVIFLPHLQVSQLGAVAQKYQVATQNASSNLSTQELQANCSM